MKRGDPTEIEEISSSGTLIAFLVRTSAGLPTETSFVTPDEANLQVGFIVKSLKDEVPRHDHKPVHREIVGTSEVLVVQSGSGTVDFFDEERAFVSNREFSAGDVIVMLAGGHGFRFDADTVLLEVKQGPYPGLDEKERF